MSQDTVRAGRYTSTSGIDRDSVPWRLWVKAKKLFWDPEDIDFSKDREDFAAFTEEQRLGVAAGASGFMVGEEAVTLDILPLLRAISDEGRLEETIFLTSFALEEAKHVDFFRLFFDAVEFDPSRLAGGGDGYADAAGAGSGVFSGELERVMKRLDTDRSPEAILDAGITYNQFIEGVLAISGYKGWERFFRQFPQGSLPGFQEGLALVQRDERRHIAYGTYLCRRIIAAHPETWDFVERRWAELTQPLLAARGHGNGRGGYTAALVQRRIDALATARNLRPEDIEGGRLEELEVTEPQPA